MTGGIQAASRRTVARWPWTAPAVVAAFIYATQARFAERAIAGLLALGIVVLAARRPDRALLALFAGLPFQGIVLAQLYAWGVPASVVRPLSAWKEALAVGVVVAGIRGYRAGSRRLDGADKLGLAFVAAVAAFAVVPSLFAPDAPLGTDVRWLGFRLSAAFVVLFLAARHARLPEDFTARAVRVVLAVGAVVAAVAVFEYFFSDAWNRFVVEQVQLVRYQVDVLDLRPIDFEDIRRYGYVGDHRFLRAGSVFFDPTPAGFFLVLPFSVAVERRLRAGLRSGGATTLVALVGTGLALTQTRAALIAAFIAVYLAVRPAPGRSTTRRMRFTLLFVGAMIVAVPAAATTGLNSRIVSTASGEDQSSEDHVDSFWNGVDAITDAPLGHGLGTSAGVGQRFDSDTAVTENGYLQVGVETGVAAMAAFAALTVVVLRRLNRTVRTVPSPSVCAIRGGATGLAVGALLLHAWNEFAVGWMTWALMGAALALWDAGARARDDAVPETAAAR